MVNKRGLSNIVATVLIILLALAAVAIVWGFLRPTFDRTAQNTALRTACYQVELEPVTCTFGTGSIVGGSYKLVSNDPLLTSVLVIFEDADGLTITAPGAKPAQALAQETVSNVDYSSIGIPIKMRVAAVVSSNGATDTCDESLKEVSC
ncbi:MAG: hypothetical protein KKD18_02310 [Nanoarchaeota archaeon]|nr:hypothetical protein [Nanoarchaeota archaeon]MBU0977224.1 hypothetical protein [Nanoarchaeota archaeon]